MLPRVAAAVWGSCVSPLVEAARSLPFDVEVWNLVEVEEGRLEECLRSLKNTDLILVYPMESLRCWELLEKGLAGLEKPIVAVGGEPSKWLLSNVGTKVTLVANQYFAFGGVENLKNLLKFLASEVLGVACEFSPPAELPWDGIYHPDASSAFNNVEEYLRWYEHAGHLKKAPTVGILFYRNYWVTGNLEVENALIRSFEAEGLNVIAAFSYSSAAEHGARTNLEIIKDFFMDDDRPRIDALVNLQWTPLGGDWRDRKTSAERAVELLKRLNVPVFHPHIAYHMTENEWRSSGQGVGGSIMAFTIALPELEGVVEPILVGVTKAEHEGIADTLVERATPVEERVRKIVRRVRRWLELQQKPPSERKLAFILHNNPCASVEATVGSASHLDSLESVARIINKLKEAGYKVENPPKDGKELIETIMNRKAISEFRWTTTEEIVRRGGVLAFVSADEYEAWFRTLPEDAQRRVVGAWGEPPGEERDGVPASMIHERRILVTGVSYGNVVVLVQPKRGCAGARCDGQVCKILHDPSVPPPHQYLATYMWLDKVFGVDAIIHVGTHGNLEFLPGKGVALSGSCFPDIAIGDVPHLYIYNSDNPPEGTIAKRRSYATLVDHMQTVMTESGLYGELKELEALISEYKKAEGARAHELQHQIWEAARKVKEIEGVQNFEELLERAHKLITQIYNTQIPDGMHVFGEIPKGDKKIEFVRGVLRQELRAFALKALRLRGESDEGGVRLLAEADELSRRVVEAALSGQTAAEIFEELSFNALDSNSQREVVEELRRMVKKISDVSSRIDSSDELGSLLRGFEGGYVEPGPSGLVTKKPEVLPTGRNFFSLDPERIPTKAAWEVGKKLAEKLLERYLRDEGKYPENVAMYWMCSDIMWSDGEQLSQILYLIGVEPLWESGKVRGFRLIPLEELRRPRIDVTIRVSGITRDNFPNVIELLDEAFHEVASLNEPLELNYVRKHAIEKFREGTGWRDATLRIFSSKPGTYGAGVNLAVYASAWKEERDLAEIFVYWNGYAYGKDIFGKEAHEHLVSQLKSVEMTFNKTTTDEYDLLGCCCYFSTHGGLTAAARTISGRDVKPYYGDTRDASAVEVRTLAEEVSRVVRTKLLNPKWVEGMKRHGYKGAGDISKRIGRVFGWQATTREVGDWIFDEIAKTFVLDEEMRHFFEENNPYALEEIERRLVEAAARNLWKPDPEVLKGLRAAYLETEGLLEERMGDVAAPLQGSSIDVLTADDVESWGEKLHKVRELLETREETQ